MSSYAVSKVIDLSGSTRGLFGNGNSENGVSGSYISDTKVCWLADGPHLQVLDSKTGSKISQWTFGAILKDASTKIVAVHELGTPYKEITLLVVGLECLDDRGMICIFDIFTGKIVRAVQLEDKVTSVHVVNTGNEVTSFPGPLNTFDGALAVGTGGGHVYIIDLCRQAVDEARHLTNCAAAVRNEVNPCPLSILTREDMDDAERCKEIAERDGYHLALHLNAVMEPVSPHFVLKGPRGDDRLYVNRQEVCVSSLLYAPQLSSILVGFNFGALQIWNLLDMTIMYTSPVYDENVPVSHFAIQEPVDDPRAFCYFWAVYSHAEPLRNSLPVACLYSLNYESKDWHEGYGYIYQNLQSCAIRFQMDLSSVMQRNGREAPIGGQCLRLHSFNKGTGRDIGSNSFPESPDESYTLCLMAWNVWGSDRQIYTCINIFDLNQWYKEQMPNLFRTGQGKAYMATTCLSDITDTCTSRPRTAIDVHINARTISQFAGAQKLEEHYHPTSLAFECLVLRENEMCIIKNHGLQRKLFRDLEVGGPLIMMKPLELYESCGALGLTPLFLDGQHTNTITELNQREFLLSIALERGMKNWLCKCAASWGNGSHRSAGLSMDLLLNWAWNRANVLKTNADNLCVSLFDHSGTKLDENANKLLSKCRTQILLLRDLYAFVCGKCSQFLINPKIVRKQFESLQNIFVYLDVLGWMINVGLLPECPPARADTNILDKDKLIVPYSVDALKDYYKQRRSSLRFMNSRRQLVKDNLILYIDKLVELCGGRLEREWKCDVDDSGQYPPASFQAVLRTYLMDEVDLQLKHSIMTYFFLDLATSLDSTRYKAIIPTLIKFPTIFQLTPSIIKVTQSFWHLDHGELGIAAEQLIDPMIKPSDLCSFHHKFVLQLLMLQEHHKLALIYFKIRQPPLNDFRDIKTVLCLYVNNNMLSDAFHLIREHNKSDDNILDILFRECLTTDQLHELVNLDLERKEEEQLLKFMEDCNYNENEDFKAVYYMLRGRFMDFKMHSDWKRSGDDGLEANRCIGHNLGSMLTELLPDISKNLMRTCMSEKFNLFNKGVVPKPMSSFLHDQEEYIKYNSNLVNACVTKARETWSNPDVDSKNSVRINQEDFPFVRAPTIVPGTNSTKAEIIYPTFVDRMPNSNLSDEDGPSPPKMVKLSPGPSDYTPQPSGRSPRESRMSQLTKIETPIIKRKISQNSTLASLKDGNIPTPQSILKVHSFFSKSIAQDQERGNSTTPEDLSDVPDDSSILVEPQTNGVVLKRYSITPRKSLLRTPSVRFTDVKTAAGSPVTASSSPEVWDDAQNFSDINPLPCIPDTSVTHKSCATFRGVTVFGSSKLDSIHSQNRYSEKSQFSVSTPTVANSQDVTRQLPAVPDENTIFKKDEVVSDTTIENADITAKTILNIPFLFTRKTLSTGPKPRRSYKVVEQSFIDQPTQDNSSIVTTAVIHHSPTHTELPEENAEKTSEIQRPSARLSARKSLTHQALVHHPFSEVITSCSLPVQTQTVSVEKSFSKIETVKGSDGTILKQIIDERSSSNRIENFFNEDGETETVEEAREHSSRHSKQITEKSVWSDVELEDNDFLPCVEEMEVDEEPVVEGDLSPENCEKTDTFEQVVVEDNPVPLPEEEENYEVIIDEVSPNAENPTDEEIQETDKPVIEVSDEDSVGSSGIQYSSDSNSEVYDPMNCAQDIITLDSSSDGSSNVARDHQEHRTSTNQSEDSRSDFAYEEENIIDLDLHFSKNEGSNECEANVNDFIYSSEPSVAEVSSDEDEKAESSNDGTDNPTVETKCEEGTVLICDDDDDNSNGLKEIKAAAASSENNSSACPLKPIGWISEKQTCSNSGLEFVDSVDYSKVLASKDDALEQNITSTCDVSRFSDPEQQTDKVSVKCDNPKSKSDIHQADSDKSYLLSSLQCEETTIEHTRIGDILDSTNAESETSAFTLDVDKSILHEDTNFGDTLGTSGAESNKSDFLRTHLFDNTVSSEKTSSEAEIQYDLLDKDTNLLDSDNSKSDALVDLLETPARRTRSSSVKSTEISTPTKSLRRSSRTASVDSPLGTCNVARRLQQSKPSAGSKATAKRRHSSSGPICEQTNGSPVAECKLLSEGKRTAAKRILRSKSVDEGSNREPVISAQKIKLRSASIVLPVIEEENKKTVSSDIDTSYLSNRRLTRRQKELMEKSIRSGTNPTAGDGDKEKFKLDMHTLDRIELLNKKDFQGPIDPDEVTQLGISPTPSFGGSNVTETNTDKDTEDLNPKKKCLRSSQSGTDNSSLDSKKGKNSPKLGARRTRKASWESVTTEGSMELRRSTRRRTKSEASDNSQRESKISNPRRKQTLTKISEESSSEQLSGESGERKGKKRSKK